MFIPDYLRRNLVSKLIEKWFHHRGLAIAFGNAEDGRGTPGPNKIYINLCRNQSWKTAQSDGDFAWWLAQTTRFWDRISISKFHSKCEALAWLFLGSHYPERYSICNNTECCYNNSVAISDKQLLGIILRLSLEDRVSAVEMIIYKASEFGVCTNLGYALLHFFVFPAKEYEVDLILSAIFREIVQSLRACNLLTNMARDVKTRRWKVPAF